MRISRRASTKIQGMHKQATDMERFMNNMVKSYGYELVRYVANKVLEKEGAKIRLTKEIERKEKELADLKGKV